jgi:hypothetical protein
MAADSGSTDAVNTGETLTFAGTANEIVTTVSNNIITIGQPDNVTIAANLTVTGTTGSTNYTTGAVVISGGVGVAGNMHVEGNHSNFAGNVGVTGSLTVAGNLTVSGTTTTVNTETLTINDNIVLLNNNATGSPSENAGIEVERGDSTNVLLRWNETTDKWEWTDDGSAYTPFANAILKTIVDAKGDLIVASGADTVTILSLGTNGQALKVNTSTTSGLEWGQAGYQPDDSQMVVGLRVFG